MALPVITAPKYQLTIPSTGKNVEYRPYLVKEEKILVLALESDDSNQMIRAIRDIINICTFGNVDANSLTIFDLEFVFLKLRAVSVGGNTSLKVKCPDCETYAEVTLDLTTVEIKGDMKPNMKIQITDEVGVIMRYPTVNGTLLDTDLKATDDYSTAISTIASCIETIYDAENTHSADNSTKQELIDFIESLSQEQFSKVNEFFNDMPTLKHDLSFDCDSCNSNKTTTIKGLQSFF